MNTAGDGDNNNINIINIIIAYCIKQAISKTFPPRTGIKSWTFQWSSS